MRRPHPQRRFLKRERAQGAHLSRALLGHHQREFREPQSELPRLSHRGAGGLGSFNLYARRWWLRALFRNLPRDVLAQGRLFSPPPVYLLTLLDHRQVWRPDHDDPHHSEPMIGEVRDAYARYLRGLNAVGMIDIATYVSAQRVFGTSRLLHFHLHVLVWNVGEDELSARCQRVNTELRPLLPYVMAADFRLVRWGHLLQVLWYVAKTPRKQYQLHRKDNGRIRQYKRAINGVNTVRLYAALGRVPLNQMTLASGAGLDVLRRVRRDLQRWREP